MSRTAYTKSAQIKPKTVHKFPKTLSLKWFDQKLLLSSIRGAISQNDVSKAMGYKFNKVNRWESGGVQMRWSDFERFCRTNAIELRALLTFFVGSSCKAERFDLVLKQISGRRDSQLIVRGTAFKEHRMRKLLNGNAEPNLEEAFALVEALTGAGKHLYSKLLGDTKHRIPESITKSRRRRKLVAEHPTAAAMSVYTQTAEYQKLRKHVPGFVGKKFGLDTVLEEKIWHQLLAEGDVVLKAQKYAINDDVRNEKTTPADFAAHRNIIVHWLQEASAVLQRMDDFDSAACFSGYRIIGINAKTCAKIEDRMAEFYNEIGSMIREASGDEGELKIRVMALQMFDPTFGR